MELIKGKTAPEVWLMASEYLQSLKDMEDFDVFLHISTPTVLSKADMAVYNEVDGFLKSHGAFGLHTIAETIFPLEEYQRFGADALYDTFPEKLKEIQRGRTDRNWGTYAYRILRQKDEDGKMFVPLKDLVEKMKKYTKYTASWELGPGKIEEDAFCEGIQIYAPSTDRKRQYGGPCLSHISFKIHDGKIGLNATYRSHYYVRRLLGNLTGLARLQYFLCRETGLAMGGLTINSTYAKLDSGGSNGTAGGWTKQEAIALVKSCRDIYTAETVHAA